MAEVVTDRETAVLVPVPEAERVVSPHRSRLDGAAALGVPAHVTVLFPFVPPASITPGVVDALAAAVATVSGSAAGGLRTCARPRPRCCPSCRFVSGLTGCG